MNKIIFVVVAFLCIACVLSGRSGFLPGANCSEKNIPDHTHHDDSHYHANGDAKIAPLSGEVRDGVRVIEVRAFRYGFSPDPIVVRKGEKVRLEFSSADVTHGFGVEELGINVSITPGKNEPLEFVAEKAGDFHVHCTVYCGLGHGDMHGLLRVLE